jgi:hypothetical protein
MNEIYVAHLLIFNKNFNKYTFYHNEQLGCLFDNQYLVSKEVVLLTINKDGKFCYLDTQKPCKVINKEDLQKSVTLFECRFCSNHLTNNMDCKETACLKSEIMGVVNIMPIYEFTKTGYIPVAIDLVKEYNNSVKDEFVLINDKNYTDTITKINSGFPKVKTKKQ